MEWFFHTITLYAIEHGKVFSSICLSVGVVSPSTPRYTTCVLRWCFWSCRQLLGTRILKFLSGVQFLRRGEWIARSWTTLEVCFINLVWELWEYQRANWERYRIGKGCISRLISTFAKLLNRLSLMHSGTCQWGISCRLPIVHQNLLWCITMTTTGNLSLQWVLTWYGKLLVLIILHREKSNILLPFCILRMGGLDSAIIRFKTVFI